MNTIFVYCTCESLEQAKRIAKDVVLKRLAACANILSKMHSIYWWNHTLEESEEVVLIFKTRKENFEPLNKRILTLHTYANPCVIGLPIEFGNLDYLKWIITETTVDE